MLQGSTQCNGITAGHDTPYRFLTVDLGATSPNVSSWRARPLRFPSGGTRPCSLPFTPGASGTLSSLLQFASPFPFASLLAVNAFTAMGEGGNPNSSPSGPQLFLGVAVASTNVRAKPRSLSATTWMFACEHLGFLQFEESQGPFCEMKIDSCFFLNLRHHRFAQRRKCP